MGEMKATENVELITNIHTPSSSYKEVLEFGERRSWHQSLSVGLRDHYVRKLAATLCSSLYCCSYDGAVMYDAKTIEEDVFKMSHSRREYYHLIAENIEEIQKTLKVKTKQNGGVMQKQPPIPLSNGDPENRSQMQQQLLLLLHANKCMRLEKAQGLNDIVQCTLPHCQKMKGIMNHMNSCQAWRNCPKPYCYSSRLLIRHWKYCNEHDCPLCSPIKQPPDFDRYAVAGPSYFNF